MPRKLFTSSSARVRLGRASREAESFSGGHGQSTSSRGYLMSKGNWNKLSERKCINCIFFRTRLNTLHIFRIVVYLNYTYRDNILGGNKMNKKRVTLSIQESTNEKLDKLAKETGMNRSTIVSLLIEKLAKGSVKII